MSVVTVVSSRSYCATGKTPKVAAYKTHVVCAVRKNEVLALYCANVGKEGGGGLAGDGRELINPLAPKLFF